MNYLKQSRNCDAVLELAARIAELVQGREKLLTFMEVCGSHTTAIYRYGLRSLLPPEVRLISGPGCPACVTPTGYLDRAIALSRLPGVIITTLGDLLRVPGSSSSLTLERGRGADVRVVYSPLDAVRVAVANPGKQVVFLGVGFESTAPTVAVSVLTAKERGVGNYFVLASHKTMPQPMALLGADPELGVDGYICPARVSAIIGAGSYRFLSEEHRLPCVVTGFEPADVMQGVEMLVRQVLSGASRVEIQHSPVVTWEGNRKAQSVLEEVFTPCDAEWRGGGVLPRSGLRIAGRYRRHDAEASIPVEVEETREQKGCLCGKILNGKAVPGDCPLFGTSCTPWSPAGVCMVSSGGSCAAAFTYGGGG